MRERLTGKLILLYTLIMFFFSMITLNANGQYVHRKTEKLPSFTYHTLDGNKYTDKNLKANSRLMIVYFNPLCEVCQKEMKEIMDNIDFFSGMQVILISPNTKEEISEFVNGYEVKKYPQITVLHDYHDVFYKQFHAIGYPSLYLYDENKNLIENFDTHTSIGDIKNAFEATSARK